MHLVASAAALALASCYTGNHRSLPGTYARSGCLDVGLSLAHDRVARDPVVAFAFGNRCAREQIVDFKAVRVVATSSHGRPIALEPDDPNRELRPMQIDGWVDGRESIAYLTTGEGIDLLQPICVDVSRLDARQPGAPAWTCLAEAQ